MAEAVTELGALAKTAVFLKHFSDLPRPAPNRSMTRASRKIDAAIHRMAISWPDQPDVASRPAFARAGLVGYAPILVETCA